MHAVTVTSEQNPCETEKKIFNPLVGTLSQTALQVDPAHFEQAGPVLRPQADQAPFIRHVRLPRTLAEAKGTFSDRSGILGSPSVHLHLHARIKGHMRRHLLQQQRHALALPSPIAMARTRTYGMTTR